MFYHYVWVRSSRYHGSEPLTYAHDSKLPTGSIVHVELQKEVVLGVVSGPSVKPRFKTKPIVDILDLPPIPAHQMRLVTWLKEYYPAPLGIVAQQLVPANFSAKQLAAERAPISAEPITDHLPPLTQEQQAALAAMAERDTYILHGTTGSGKTRLYIELSLQALAAGKSAIILTPEISLTSQLAHNFRDVFGDRVIVMHSQQAPAERQKAWLDCLRAGNEPVIVIGPRSALFSPIAKPGLIVLDESHEAAYKQEQAPQYQTGRVASYLASLTRSTVILGSATPAVADYYLAEHKGKSIVRLQAIARENTVEDSKITVVDRRTNNLFSRSVFISDELIKAIEKALSRGEQSLLYLNRRGTARMILCENCGWQAACPHCDVPLTYHGDHHELRCHSCSYRQAAPVSCPECKHPNIVYKTAGTKAITEEIERLCPGARVARFDTDNTKAERFEQHYDRIKAGEVDILVGTQMLAKGLDLPRLSTLGVLLADSSLYMPDFSAEERTYQLITQVLGRIGRGHVAGRAVIQTYNPDHPVLKDALSNDYQHFYKTQLKAREQFLFPPFCYLLKLTVRRASSKAAETASQNLKHDIETGGYRVRVEGPAPAFYERFQNKYQWQLVVKARERSELLRIIQHLPANWSYDIDPADLL
jgi:primosomal protein N' (replication factor Y) (superfamily II helicase)